MATVSADGSSQSFGGITAQIGCFGLRVGGHPALSLRVPVAQYRVGLVMVADASSIADE